METAPNRSIRKSLMEAVMMMMMISDHQWEQYLLATLIEWSVWKLCVFVHTCVTFISPVR